MRFTVIFPSVFALTLLLTGPTLRAETAPQNSAETLFKSGVAALQKNDAKTAAEELRKAFELNPDQPVVLYNLGVAEQRLGRNGAALGLWRKALTLSPEFYPARRAIDWTTKRLEKSELARDVEFWESLRSAALVNVSLISYAGLFAVLLFIFGWTLLGYLGKRRRALLDESRLPTFPWIAGFLGVLSFAFAILTVAKFIDGQDLRATIVAKKVEARSAPADDGTPLFELYEGLEVVVQRISGDWAQVTYPGGSTGWVPRGMIFTTNATRVAQ